MKTNIKLIIGFVTLLFFNCSESYSVEELRTAQILETLSADELKGRFALSPEIKLAEEFIARELESAGLVPHFGNSFHQPFILSESLIETSIVIVDDKEIKSDQYFAFTVVENLVTNSDLAPVFHIKQGDNFRERFNEFDSYERDAIVLVDPSFEELFNRYRSFYSREHRFLTNTSKGNLIFILSESDNDDISIEFISKIEQKPLANIVGKIEGIRKSEYVIFSAHHDHIGLRTPVGADSIANGANDNASGVTAVIQLAHHFAAKPKPERTLLFVTFTAEEFGGYGSEYFSKQLSPDEIIAMINIEMIGKPALSGPNTAWITGYNKSTFGELLSRSTEGTIYEFYPDPYPNQNLFYRSDNATLARLGVPAHTISTTPIDVDTDYHQVSDEFETINIPHLNNTIKAIAKGADGIVSGKYTPSRVDTTTLD